MGAWRSLRSWLGGVLLFAVLLVGLRNWLRDPWDHHHHHQQHPAHHAGAARNRGRTGAVEPPTGRQALAHHPQGFYRPHHHQHDQLQAPCPAGSWLNVQSGICTLLTRCNATTEVVVAAPTLTSDRVCHCRAWASYTSWQLAWRASAVAFLFVGIAVVCDDYFTPALEVLSEVWGLSDDVAGATFMAAGSSAPELFTSVAAVFAPTPGCGEDTESVGVSTIVGSAVFNLLMIIGLSALLAGRVLQLSWKPLARDCGFFISAIGVLYLTLRDGLVHWYESCAMFGMYCAYILFLAFNRQILGEYDHLAEKLQAKTIEALEAGTLKMLAAAAAAEASSLSSASSSAGPGAKGVTAAHSPTAVLVGSGAGDPEWSTSALRQQTSSSSGGGKHGGLAAMGGGGLPGLEVTPTQSPRHLSEISSTMGKLLFALFLLPWKVAFSWTVPDVTDPRYTKHHMVAFLLSICWIGVLCYYMVMWSVDVAQMLQISLSVMAFTILAVGTSVPDAMASILEARKGKADMAVSNALGSNIFDILFGLSMPYLMVASRNALDSDSSTLAVIEVCNKDVDVYIGTLVVLLLLTCCCVGLSNFSIGRPSGTFLISLYVLTVGLELLRDRGVLEIGETCALGPDS